MARKPATQDSARSDDELDPPSERSEQNLDDDDAEEEVLAPRSTKLRAHNKWDVLKPKSLRSGNKEKPPPKTTGKKEPKPGPKKELKPGPKKGQKKAVDAVEDYRAPKSIQLNTSDDGEDDIPKASDDGEGDIPKASQARRGTTIKEVKSKSASRESKSTEAESRSKVKKSAKSAGGQTKRKSNDEEEEEEEEEESGEPSEEDEEDGEEDDQDEDGAMFNAEALYWADGDNAEDPNDGAYSDAGLRHPTPSPSKRMRRESTSDNESERSALIRPSARKRTKPTSDVENAHGNGGGDSHLAKGKQKPAAMGRGGEGRSDEVDSEDERARARARARQKEKARQKERAKASKAKAKEGPREKPKVATQKANKQAVAKSRGSDGGRVSSVSKRKHDRGANGEKETDEEAAVPPKKRRADLHSDSDDEDDEEIDDQDTTIGLKYDQKGRPNLGEQAPRVRRITRLAIFVVKKNVLLKCAFPDGVKDLQDQARSALIRCAQDVGYRDMVKRLKDDNQEDYWRKFASLPAQRAFSLRGLVKKITDGAVAGVYGLQPGCPEKIEWLQRNLAFIYPHDYKALKVQSQGKLAFTLPIFESVLRTAFYDNPRSFGYKVLDGFESSVPERPLEKEVPASMLALVATAVYASLDDYRATKYHAGKFEANVYTPVFKHCISFLSKMKSKQPNKYHTLMSGLYQRLTGATPGVADLNDDAFTDFSADEE